MDVIFMNMKCNDLKIEKIASKGLLFTTLLTYSVFASSASTTEEESLKSIYGDEEYISIATGYKQSIQEAPAVTSIITEQDIRNSGATDVDELLETVAGLHVARNVAANNPIYTIRGIYSEFNQQVLVLVNGIPVTNVYGGDRGKIWAGMPVHSIDRIEIIRGPGSSVYGADAFSGVINIIIKNYDSIANNEIGFKLGSFDTQELWWIQKFALGDLKAALTLEYSNTDGYKKAIETDLQSTFDALFGSNASLAPGSINTGRELIDSRIDLNYKNLTLRLGYQGRFNVETGAGVSSSLDPDGELNAYRFSTDLTYEYQAESSNWGNISQLSFFETSEKFQTNLSPPMSLVSFGGPPQFFAEGVIGNPQYKENHYRGNTIFSYTKFNKHRIRFGAGFSISRLRDIKETKNFDPLGNPLGGLIDVTDNEKLVFILPQKRELYYGFIQDEWNFSPDWSLTTGIRYDRYSDFGQTINPRLALVWQTSHNLTTKLLYGRAFRAPSFAGSFLLNNPVVIGNPDLDPETIDTIEFVVNHQPLKNLDVSLNVFAYEMKDIIRGVPEPAPSTKQSAQNTGRQVGYGFETEAHWQARDDLTLIGHYAFQRSTDESTDTDAGNAPHHQVYLRGEWQFHRDWQLTSQVKWISERKRAKGDARSDLEGYATVDLSLRYGNESNPWSAALTVRNLFDVDAREPTVSPGLIPDDIPLAGVGVYGEVEFRF